MSTLLEDLGQRIRAARTAQGWSQRQLCARAGVSPRFLVKLEGGEGNVSVLRLAEVAGALEVSLVSLLAGLGPIRDAADREAQRVVGSRAGGPRSVALVGLRGAGKSTVGAAAAARAGWAFVELDRRVVERAGMTLGEIFEYHGVEHYRDLSVDALRDVLGGAEPVVIEVGGSLVLDERVFALLQEQTTMVWLRATPEEHLARVRDQGDLRPMAGRDDALGELRAILGRREPLYALAHASIDTSALGEAATVDQVVALLGGWPE